MFPTRTAGENGRPTAVVARTLKGKGVNAVENKDGWHGKALPPDMAERAIAELGGVRHLTVEPRRPEMKVNEATQIEVWVQDESRIGQKGKVGRRWAETGSHPTTLVQGGF